MRSGRAAPGSPAVRRHGPVRWPDLPVQQFYGPLQQVHGPAPRGLDRQPRLSVPRADDGRARPAHPYPWPGERG
ncbi:hypothetical protein FAF44_52505 [Nonomuraea sp. MG754425]|nr:hypothetical protein [Nonomuraea sp. MG754425]